MNKRNRILGGLAAMLLSLPAVSDEVETLHIWMADGTQTTIQLYTRPQVIFDGDVVRFESPVQSLELPANEVVRFTYSGIPIPTDVNTPQVEAGYRQDGENLYFSGDLTPDKIQLFTSDGKLLPVSVRRSSGQLCLPLSSIPQGIYVLSVNGKTSKLVRK